MEVIKRLTNASRQTAYIINDGNETYPIFEESLHSKLIFDQLTQSGYEFCSLPFGFKRDGKAITDMPAEPWNVTPAEESDMYDLLDADMYTTQELMGMVTEEQSLYLPEPETAYTITTREAFLEFLQLFNGEDAFAEFRPVNSFVHPEARFTFEEYRDPANKEYVDILSRYRTYNFHRWQRLLAWMNTPLQSYDDILRNYFKWGVDGLYLPIVSEHENQLSVPEFTVLSSEDRWSSLFYEKEIGLVDNNGTILTPPGSEGIRWDFTYSKEAMQNKMSTLRPNEVTVTKLKTPTKQTCIVKDGKDISIHITESSVYVSKNYYPTLRMYPNGFNMPPALPKDCIPSRFKEMADDAYMHALASDTIKRRVAPCSASSAKALELVGMSKHCILNYIVNMIDFSKDQSEDGLTEITWNDVNRYCNGEVEEGALKDYLDGIVNGTYNIDSIKAAQDAISQYSAASVYEQIYAMHKIFGISIDDIKQKINAMGEDDSFTVTSDKGYYFKFTQPMNRDLFTAFNLDVQNYRVQAANEAVEWIYVLQAARELGSVDADRHVAMTCYSVNRMRSNVKMLCNVLEDKYEAEVRSKLTNELEIASWLKDSMYFVGCRYFEAALKGTITYPAKLGGRVETVSQDMRDQLVKTLEYKADMLSAICEGNVSGGEFHFFFANAYVTPFYVIPIKNHMIEQIDFAAAWRDYSNNDAALNTLYARHAIPMTGFTAWENWAVDPEYELTEHAGFGDTDMYGYYTRSVEWCANLANDIVYKAVPHPMEYLYPYLYGKDEEEDTEFLPQGQERTAPPKFSVTAMKTLTMKDFEKVLDISGSLGDNVKFKPFTGLTSDDFYNIDTPIKALNTQVPIGKRGINVIMPDKFCFSDGVIHDYSEIPNYANDTEVSILNVQGREYIVRDYRGTYYRVEV